MSRIPFRNINIGVNVSENTREDSDSDYEEEYKYHDENLKDNYSYNDFLVDRYLNQSFKEIKSKNIDIKDAYRLLLEAERKARKRQVIEVIIALIVLFILVKFIF